ncbi:MAG TPA: hypothetical protein VFW29_09060 [Solirubrobacteraceae bacterium]|nr:hypothetical protein [Solirubrobacteraceae bacterium]
MSARASHAIASLLRRSRAAEDGQTLAEYSLITALVALALLGAFAVLTGDTEAVFDAITGAL